MGLNVPAALALAGLALPIIVFYMLRLRRQPRAVSSLLLWQKVLEDQTANAPWQRLRRNLLLLLQLLILALLVLALSRPYRTVEATVSGNVILLIDVSASMQATDVPPSRLEAAKDEARRIISTLGPENSVTLIAVADTPRPLGSASANAERATLTAALDTLPATETAANWETALALAAARASTQAESNIVILSDGAINPAEQDRLRQLSLPATVQWLAVGQSEPDNQAIVALSSREGRQGTELFARVVNYSSEPVSTRLEIRVDEQLFDARNLDLAAYPTGSTSLTFTNLPPTAQAITARLSRADDLALDNQASTYRRATAGRVLLVSPGNAYLERAFGLIPGLSLVRSLPNTPPSEEPFDLIIYDRTLPNTLPPPPTSLLFIAPPSDTALFAVTGTFTPGLTLNRNQSHPVMTYLTLRQTRIAQAQRLTLPGWAVPLISQSNHPLLAVGEQNGQRVGVLAFNLLQSNLPLQIDFPILINNLSSWLLNQPALFNEESNTPSLLNPAESNLRPPSQPPFQAGSGGETALAGSTLTGQQEFWWVLTALAVLVLLWEWIFYWRGND
jgi:hypothetical protein